MQKEFEIAKIIAAAISNKITENDLKILEEWQKQSPKNKLLYHNILKKENIRTAGELLHRFNKQRGWKNIRKQISSKPVLYRKHWLKISKYAAILILSIGGWLLLNSNPNQSPATIVQNSFTPDSCLSQGIILKLADGNTINLKETKGQIKITDNQCIANHSKGILSYKEVADRNDLSQTFNEIFVNRGEVYQLELCDGSYIHLNSMSQIKYPVNFGKNNRIIELEGEAYLQIAKDSLHPFIVKTKDLEIKVLGTQFNISAYPEDPCITTTLIEGAVQVESRKYQVSAQLRPHEQLQYNKLNQQQTLEITDINEAIAWLKGKIRYKDITLERLMTILKRWYYIEVEYETPEIKNTVFGCNFNRMDSIDKVIEIFEQTNKIKINKSGKILTFMNHD